MVGIHCPPLPASSGPPESSVGNVPYIAPPRTAPPGKVPAVPTPGVARTPSPDEGMVVPHLSAADAAKIKRGESIEIKVPGGSLTVGPPKKEKSK